MEQTHINGWQKKMDRHLIMIVSSTNRWSSWKRSEGGGTEVSLGSRRWVDMNKNWGQINVSSGRCELLLLQCPPRTKTMAMAMVRAMTMARRGRGRWSRRHMADGEWNKCQTNEDSPQLCMSHLLFHPLTSMKSRVPLSPSVTLFQIITFL